MQRVASTLTRAKSSALALACTIEARLRLFTILKDKEAILGFDQAHLAARESLLAASDASGIEEAMDYEDAATQASCGLANPQGIILDSSEIEINLPRVAFLLQVRILLSLGATNDSSNVYETR